MLSVRPIIFKLQVLFGCFSTHPHILYAMPFCDMCDLVSQNGSQHRIIIRERFEQSRIDKYILAGQGECVDLRLI